MSVFFHLECTVLLCRFAVECGLIECCTIGLLMWWLLMSIVSVPVQFLLCLDIRVEVCLPYMSAQNEFWTEMSKPRPAMSRLSALGDAIERASNECQKCFEQQLTLLPNSAPTLRRYGHFLKEVGPKGFVMCGASVRLVTLPAMDSTASTGYSYTPQCIMMS